MKAEKIIISKFKSIDNLEIPLQSYGTNDNISNCSILVGINESGKSNILEAINLISSGFDDTYNYDSTLCKLALVDPDYEYIDIDLSFSFSKKDNEKLLSKFKTAYSIPDDELNKLFNITHIKRNIYLESENKGILYLFDLDKDFPYYKYALETNKEEISKPNGQAIIKEVKTILKLTDPTGNQITKLSAGKFVKSNQTLLTNSITESLIRPLLEITVPQIIYWKSSPEYLIDNPIPLTEFKNNTAISHSLKYIFNIYGKKDDDSIKLCIEKALKNDEYKSQLEDELTESVTKHINRIWKEHQINFKIKIDADICKVHVEDKSKIHRYYKMSQRSAGFKQFVSLILSLSAQNDTNSLKDQIILLDEPEVHLHPSGIRYMRDELLKIGKNNFVFVSTHSHYMVDTNTIDRHWLVEKIEGITTVNQIKDNSSLHDEVLAKAFGLNVMKELMPQNILLVEGGGDKAILNHILSIKFEKQTDLIKPAGGCAKINQLVSLLHGHDISSYVLVDDDEEGRKAKTDIVKLFKPAYNKNNVFTLKDIHDKLPNFSTLEDLFPIQFVKNFFDKSCAKEFTLDANQALLIQLKNQDDQLKNKDKLDKLKTELSNKFIAEFKNKDELENGAELFCEFVDKLKEKIKI